VVSAAASAGLNGASFFSGVMTKSWAALMGWVTPDSFCQLTGPTCWTAAVPLL
jgi:hypothetical protein